MNFKKFMSAGFAAVTGIAIVATGANADDTTPDKVYTNADFFTETNPFNPATDTLLTTTISDTDGSAYRITLKTSLTTADYLAFGFNWSGPDLLAGSNVNLVSAFGPPGGPPDDGQALDIGNTAWGLCGANGASISACTYQNNSGLPGVYEEKGAANFEGGESATSFNYIFAIGTMGQTNKPDTGNTPTYPDFIDEFTFDILVDDTLFSANPPKYSQIAARAQSTGTSDSGSLKNNMFACDEPCTFNNIPRVPEIDGPVLIQVGFALSGLYLLLLGRRREEDELVHAA